MAVLAERLVVLWVPQQHSRRVDISINSTFKCSSEAMRNLVIDYRSLDKLTTLQVHGAQRMFT